MYLLFPETRRGISLTSRLYLCKQLHDFWKSQNEGQEAYVEKRESYAILLIKIQRLPKIGFFVFLNCTQFSESHIHERISAFEFLNALVFENFSYKINPFHYNSHRAEYLKSLSYCGLKIHN